LCSIPAPIEIGAGFFVVPRGGVCTFSSMKHVPEIHRAADKRSLPATVFLEGRETGNQSRCRYPEVRTTEPFDRVILSPNGDTGPAGLILLYAGTDQGDVYSLVTWIGPQGRRLGPRPYPAPVRVDVLELPAAASEVIVTLRIAIHDEHTHVSRVGVTLYNSEQQTAVSAEDFNPEGAGHASTALDVPFVSQFTGAGVDGDSLCCPTSAVMLLHFWGTEIDVEHFARLSYDTLHQLHGNWSLTAAALSTFGLRSWVQKHTSLQEIYQVVAAGRPVIASVRFGAGELPGAPIKQTRGHLLVVRGFTEQGDVLVSDPAGTTAATGIISYDRRAFARAWLGHGGIAIHAVPEEMVG